jgi:hypothetical protein
MAKFPIISMTFGIGLAMIVEGRQVAIGVVGVSRWQNLGRTLVLCRANATGKAIIGS